MEDPLEKLSVKIGWFEASASGRFAIVTAILSAFLAGVFAVLLRATGFL